MQQYKWNRLIIWVLGWFVLPMMPAGSAAKAAVNKLPAHLAPEEVDGQDADKEVIGGPFPGLLLIPHWDSNTVEPKYNQVYHAACAVYQADHDQGDATITGYSCRFVLHTPDAETMPLLKRVGRLLLLLHGEDRERLRHDHPADRAIVYVWLTRHIAAGLATDVGGEQFADQIFLHNIFADRTQIEWAREIAHEYGHYALPGVSGFKSPEEWANGVLGERLFLKWLAEDLRAGYLHPADLPFVTPEQLDEFLARQVDPLLRRFARESPEPRFLTRRDAGGMDYYTGLVLYVDSVYGSGQLLNALTYTAPKEGGVFVQAPDFLRGVLLSLRGATDLTVSAPLLSRTGTSDTFLLYLPAGQYQVTTDGPIKGWKFPPDVKGLHTHGRESAVVNIPDWFPLTITLTQPSDMPPHVVFHRQGAEVQ